VRGDGPVAEWIFWVTLAAMLGAGYLSRVGLFLDRFAIGAALAALSALLFDFQLEAQLRAFLLASAAALAAGRIARALRPGGA